MNDFESKPETNRPTSRQLSLPDGAHETAARDVSLDIKQLWKQRPTNKFLRWNVLLTAAACCVSWIIVEVDWSSTFTARRMHNLERFVGEINPLRDQAFEWHALFDWTAKLWSEQGADAALSTFWISVAAIVLAGATSVVCVFPSARNLATPAPFAQEPKSASLVQKAFWAAIVSTSRGLFFISRAIPEYIWAFLLIAMFGPSVWPAILALMIHNFGILGKLGAEVVENIDPAIPSALRAQGLSRTQIALTAITPMSLGKWLLFLFYRWETCIRDATVLGMLGIVSLGFVIRESRAKDRYDEMLAFIVMGSLLVLLADIASAIARRYLRTS